MSAQTDSGSGEHERAEQGEPGRTLVGDGAVEWGRTAIDRTDSATVVSGFGVIWTVLALAATLGGYWGATLGIALAFVWLTTSAPVAYAVAHFGAIPFMSSEFMTGPFVLVEIGLVIMLLGTLRRSPAPIRALGVSIGAILGLVGLVLILAVADWPIAARAAAVAGVVLLLSYLIHRSAYARVALIKEGPL